MQFESLPSDTDADFGQGDWSFQAEPLAFLYRRLQSLSDEQIDDAVASTIAGQKYYTRDQPSWSDRGDLGNLFVLERGFAFKFEILQGGQRHIADFYGPGAICNWGLLSDCEEQDHLVFKARTAVTMLDAGRLQTMFDARPGLENLFERHELARAGRTTQRVRSLISLPATHKLMIVLLDLFDEYAAAGLAHEWLRLPFTQEELGDLLGLTPVHVSRTLAKLEEENVIRRDRRAIQLCDPEAVRRELGYRRSYGREAAEEDGDKPKSRSRQR